MSLIKLTERSYTYVFAPNVRRICGLPNLLAFVFYALIYFIAVFSGSGLSLFAIALGLLGSLAVWQAWNADERRRIRVIRGYEQGPDDYPDLRSLALITGLQLLLLLPLLYWQMQERYGMFDTRGETNFFSWLVYTFRFTLEAIVRDSTAVPQIQAATVRHGSGNNG